MLYKDSNTYRKFGCTPRDLIIFDTHFLAQIGAQFRVILASLATFYNNICYTVFRVVQNGGNVQQDRRVRIAHFHC